MSKELLVVSHMPQDEGGRINEIAKERGFGVTVFPVSESKGKFPDVKRFTAVAIMGGDTSVHSEDNFMPQEIEFARQVLAENVPVIGECLGGHVLWAAADGTVGDAAKGEYGMDELEVTDAGLSDKLLQGIIDPIKTMQLHHAEVKFDPVMEKKAVLLARDIPQDENLAVPNQIFRIGDSAWGIQSHLEYNPKTLAKSLDQYKDYFGFSEGDIDKMMRDFVNNQEAYLQAGTIIYNNFFSIAAKRQDMYQLAA